MPFFAPAAEGRKSCRLCRQHSPQTKARLATYRNLSNRLRTHGRILRRPSPDLKTTDSTPGPSATATFALAKEARAGMHRYQEM